MIENRITSTIEALKTLPIIMAGPCSVESREQIYSIAQKLSYYNIKFLRGGAYKPRTSPKSFQGLGDVGFEHLRSVADEFGMFTVSEIMDETQLESAYDYVDVIQVGSRNMAAYSFLKAIGRKTASDHKPVLLKRGFSSTLQELLYAAEYIVERGNPNVMLCLRGIRTFEQIESDMRFTPDLGAILELKEKTNLKIIFDPSHSTGNRKYVNKISQTALFMGADGLLIETHINPEEAKSDKKQCILPDELADIVKYVKNTTSNE